MTAARHPPCPQCNRGHSYLLQSEAGPYYHCRRCGHEWEKTRPRANGSGVIAPPSYLHQIARGWIK